MSGFDAYAAAQDTVTDIENIVAGRIDSASKVADAAQVIALGTIADLKGTKFTVPDQPPTAPKVDAKLDIKFNVPNIRIDTFGSISGPTTSDKVEDLVPVRTVTTPTIPAFVSSIGSLTIPQPPSENQLTKPDDKTFDPSVTIPNAPNTVIPALDNLVPITIPAFTFPTLPTFDATAPEFEGSALPPVFNWTEPVYHNEILDEALVVVRRMFAGGTGLPPAIEQAIFGRMNDREDQLVAKAVSEVYTEWSERGFTAPNGMTNARIDQVRQDALLKKQGANRELAIKVAEIEVENLKFAVTQALAAEQILINKHLNIAERMFQAAKYQIQALVEIYNAQVNLFNARQIAYQTAASVYKVRLEAALSELEVFKAQIQGELAKAQVNESTVRAYVAKIQALGLQVDVYKAQLQGAQTKVDVTKAQIEAYKATIEAYATNVQAEKVRFDTYATRVGAEVAKANIIDAQARAYAAQIQGISTGVMAQKTATDADISTNEIKIKEFIANVEREKSEMQYQLSAIQAAVSAFTADTQRFIAQTDTEKTKAQLQIATSELQSKTAISLYGAMTSSYNARMEQLIREATLTVEGLKSAGQIATTLAAAAYSAVHVGATLSGGGSLNASGAVSDSYSRSESTSTNTNYNYEGV